jgi:hypothetical protein
VDHDNLRSALEWSLNESVSGERCRRIAAPLGHYWEVSSKLREGREQLEAALSRSRAGAAGGSI